MTTKTDKPTTEKCTCPACLSGEKVKYWHEMALHLPVANTADTKTALEMASRWYDHACLMSNLGAQGLMEECTEVDAEELRGAAPFKLN